MGGRNRNRNNRQGNQPNPGPKQQTSTTLETQQNQPQPSPTPKQEQSPNIQEKQPSSISQSQTQGIAQQPSPTTKPSEIGELPIQSQLHQDKLQPDQPQPINEQPTQVVAQTGTEEVKQETIPQEQNKEIEQLGCGQPGLQASQIPENTRHQQPKSEQPQNQVQSKEAIPQEPKAEIEQHQLENNYQNAEQVKNSSSPVEQKQLREANQNQVKQVSGQAQQSQPQASQPTKRDNSIPPQVQSENPPENTPADKQNPLTDNQPEKVEVPQPQTTQVQKTQELVPENQNQSNQVQITQPEPEQTQAIKSPAVEVQKDHELLEPVQAIKLQAAELEHSSGVEVLQNGQVQVYRQEIVQVHRQGIVQVHRQGIAQVDKSEPVEVLQCQKDEPEETNIKERLEDKNEDEPKEEVVESQPITEENSNTEIHQYPNPIQHNSNTNQFHSSPLLENNIQPSNLDDRPTVTNIVQEVSSSSVTKQPEQSSEAKQELATKVQQHSSDIIDLNQPIEIHLDSQGTNRKEEKQVKTTEAAASALDENRIFTMVESQQIPAQEINVTESIQIPVPKIEVQGSLSFSDLNYSVNASRDINHASAEKENDEVDPARLGQVQGERLEKVAEHSQEEQKLEEQRIQPIQNITQSRNEAKPQAGSNQPDFFKSKPVKQSEVEQEIIQPQIIEPPPPSNELVQNKLAEPINFEEPQGSLLAEPDQPAKQVPVPLQQEPLQPEKTPLGTKIIISSIASVALGGLAYLYGKSPQGGLLAGAAAFAATFLIK